MPSVLIRNIDDVLHKRLEDSAASHRRSLEDEARELLRAAVATQDTRQTESAVGTPAVETLENIADAARRLFGPTNGFDLEIPPRGSLPRRPPPDFSDY